MTHKEAVMKALEELGGKAKLKQIYPVAIKLIGNKSHAVDVKAIIRRELNSSPLFFKPTDGEKGSWELLSYQDEIASRDQRILELEEEVTFLKRQKTEDDFVRRFVDKVKHNLKRDKKTVEEIRKLMDALDRSDADKELDEWLQGKGEKKIVKKVIQKNYNSQIFTGNVTDSEFTGGTNNERRED